MSSRWLTWSALVVASLVGGVACGPLDEATEPPPGVNGAALSGAREEDPPSRRECDYRDPDRSYVSRSPRQCATIQILCVEGTLPFNDVCGCGCEVAP